MDNEQTDTPESPDFGPGGYLPDRASRRARKIVLRAPMGIQWVIGALVVGLVVVGAGVALLADDAPGGDYVFLGPVDGTGTTPVFGKEVEFQVLGAPGFDEVLVVAIGRPRVFTFTGERPAYCADSGLLEAADGRSWRLTGRGLGGAPSLTEHPSVVYEGDLYADPTTALPTLTPDAADADAPEQLCGGNPTPPAPSASPTP